MARVRAVALAALILAASALACYSGLAAAWALDRRYQETRFRPERIGQCPLVLYANTATPMCRPTDPGW